MRLLKLLEDTEKDYEFDSKIKQAGYPKLSDFIRAYPDAWPDPLWGNLSICSNGLHTLEGSPQTIKGNFFCGMNFLTSLKDGPKTVSHWYSCANNRLTDISDAPMELETFNFNSNDLTSLEGIGRKYIKRCVSMNTARNEITSHILGLVLVKDLQFVTYDDLIPGMPIVETYLNQPHQVLDCKEHLISVNLKEQAKL